MIDKNLEKKIYLNKLSFLYGELPVGVLASLFLGLILVLILREDVHTDRLAIWYGLTILVSVFRFYSYFSFKADEERDEHRKKYYMLIYTGVILSATLWGSSSFYIFPDSNELKLFVLFCIAGLSAGATGSLSSIFKVYMSFVLVVLVPFIIVFIFEASSYGIFISTALIFYIAVISSTALKISKNYDQTLRLRFKNDDMVEELRKKAILAEQANEAKSSFLSTMSHEIRTPLNAIIGYIDILRKNETDVEKHRKLDIIDNSSRLLLSVINDILDFSKISAGKLRLESIECNIKEELIGLIELFSPLCKEKKISLNYEIASDIPVCIKTDILRLSQIINNLLSNAIKFTPEGKSIRLNVRYEQPHIYFEIIDEGIGIDEEHQKLIFESFKQADSSTTRKYGGTGLGLTISHELSLLFGSKLEVTSSIGKGSRFYFSIEADVCECVKKEKAELAEVHFNHEKILVAEDNKTNQMLVSLLLEDLGLDVVMVNDGKEAVDRYDASFALVLMDINMPNMNGKEAMLAIKKQYPDSIIVALTANVLSDDKNDYLDSGFDDYISKPIDAEALAKVLSRLVKQR